MIVGRVLLGIGNGIISGVFLLSQTSASQANLCPAIVPAFIQESSVGTEQGRSQDILLTVGLGVL